MPGTRSVSRELTRSLLFVSLALPLSAQCTLQWQPGAPVQGIRGDVTSLARLPNGDLVAVGHFPLADGAVANNVARHDGTQWRGLGTGVDFAPGAVTAMPNGDVIVSGGFSHAGGAPANRIARWNGTSWSPLGAGLDGDAPALLPLPNGDLIAGGYFANAGGAAANHVARWNGTSWSQLGAGIDCIVKCMGVLPNGDIVAAGGPPYDVTGAIAMATWDGTAWHEVPGTSNWSVSDLAVLPNGDVAVVGFLDFGATLENVAIVSGATLQPIPVPPGVFHWGTIDTFANGDLVIGGFFQGSPTTGNIARWNGTAWTQIGNGAPVQTAALLRLPNDDLIAAGSWDVTPNSPIARYDGTGWVEIGAPPPPVVAALGNLHDGDVVLGGTFTSLGGVPVNNVARWRNGVVSALGSGVDGAVTSLCVAPDGSVIVCGAFQSAGGAPANRVARWDGSGWTPVGTGLPWAADLVAAASGSQVLARSGSEVWYHDGTAWAPVAMSSTFTITTFAAAPEGDFVLGGTFGTAHTTRFSHGVLTPTTASGTTPTFARQIGNTADGQVLACLEAAGAVPTIRRLDGNSWTTLGAPFPFGGVLSSMPNGDPIAFAGLAPYRFDGTTWTLIPGMMPIIPSASLSMTSTDAGQLLLAGSGSVGNVVSAGLAYAQATCPATAIPVGAGCTGIGGPMELAVRSRPWTGGTFRSVATGFPALSLALHAVGVQPANVPLPISAPGCMVFVTAFAHVLLLPAAGEAAADIVVPRSPTLVGAQLWTQVIGLEFDASSTFVQLTSTNGLELTVGGV